MPKCHLDEWQLFYDKYFFATRSWMINASPEGHLAKAVTAFLLFNVGNSMDNSLWRAHFFPEGINEILLVASPANSKATTRMSQTQTFSYKPQLFPFPKAPMDRINPVGAAHPSPKDHMWTMLPKDWQEKRAGGWVIFQRGSLGNRLSLRLFQHILCLQLLDMPRKMSCLLLCISSTTWTRCLPEKHK